MPETILRGLLVVCEPDRHESGVKQLAADLTQWPLEQQARRDENSATRN
jgi:hypothetical protein